MYKKPFQVKLLFKLCHFPFLPLTVSSCVGWLKDRTVYTHNLFRGCKRMRLAAHRSLCQSCCILHLWNSYCPYTRLRGEVKRERSLDWNIIWSHSTKYLAFHHNYLHKLGETGHSLIFFLLRTLSMKLFFILLMHNKALLFPLKSLDSKKMNPILYVAGNKGERAVVSGEKFI